MSTFKELANDAHLRAQLSGMFGDTKGAADSFAVAACYAMADCDEGREAAGALFGEVFPCLAKQGADLAQIVISDEVESDVGTDIVHEVYAKLGAVSAKVA